MSFPRQNNLELLRLVFAVQVMLFHAAHHLSGVRLGFLDHFPGVPAFFFVSGFLIYASCVKSRGLPDYLRNRFLRLYPGLLFVSLGGLMLIAYAKGAGFLLDNAGLALRWVVAQLTLGQAYNPAAFRDVGVGVVNGSLWTITVELLFYMMVPLLIWLERGRPWLLPVLLLASLALYAFGRLSQGKYLLHGRDVFDYLSLTPLFWGWMFAFGICAYKYFDRLQPYLKWGWLAIPGMALLIALNAGGILLNTNGNYLGLLYFALYIAVILYVAFEVRPLLLGFDLSYGIYIWHMIFVNLALVAGWQGVTGVAFALVATLLTSLVSWYLIERPALSLKHYTLKAGE